MPSSNRPPLITSIVDASLAVNAGFRKPVQMTMWPMRTRFVTIASTDRVENDSNVISSVGSGTVVKWSKTHSDSKPSSSAWRASSTVRTQARAGSQPAYSRFQPWGMRTPTSTGNLLVDLRNPTTDGGSEAATGLPADRPRRKLGRDECDLRSDAAARARARAMGLHRAAVATGRAALSPDRDDRRRAGPG